ncbi:MAG: ATP-dependent DNA helicase RecG [Ndongobacter sp.]|nr:ATP-dependent DNA helicase RecG [Ndongobacter sp.]
MDLTQLKGIGAKKAARFARLGVDTAEQLVCDFPRRYEDRTRICSVEELQEGVSAVLVLRLLRIYPAVYLPGRRSLQRVLMADDSGEVQVIWHNQPYRAKSLRVGECYCVYGIYRDKQKALLDPVLERSDVPSLAGLEPVYALCEGLRNGERKKLAEQALEKVPLSQFEILPEGDRCAFGLRSIEWSYRTRHKPASFEELQIACRELDARRWLVYLLALGRIKEIVKRSLCETLRPVDMTPFFTALPFSLTAGQQAAFQEIQSDLLSDEPMNRLLQGDVGSGKTAVAFAAAYLCVQNGLQAALMAPTETLARQHIKTAQKLFAPLGVAIHPLLGASPAKERQRAFQTAAEGESGLWIGTHALFSDGVAFPKLGLVITDEQHRFGVLQRKKLQQKASIPHTLVLSATPIPRTLTLSALGDLSLSQIAERPPGRQPIGTYVVDGRYEKRILAFLEKEFEKGHQAYFVCPRIDDSEDELGHWSIVNVAARCQKGLSAKRRMGVLHAQLKAEEKEAVFTAFRNGEIDLLVATTVIEVGVDVPNATVIVIGAAERFGLAQLHQLRGRVGRGAGKSHCILVAQSPSPSSLERLRVLEKSEDGFEIARRDLALRGAGERFGTQQHGVSGLYDRLAQSESGALELARDWMQRYEALLAEAGSLPEPLATAVAQEKSRFSEIALN